MTGPEPHPNAPQDLMLPFGPLADEAGRDVVLSGEHADAVLGYCRAMGDRFGAPGYLRYLFGLPVNEALLSGYRITQRALRETTPHACAQEIARTALELLPGPGRSGRAGETPAVLDLFAGVGQMAYSYAKAGCHVEAVDNDPASGTAWPTAQRRWPPPPGRGRNSPSSTSTRPGAAPTSTTWPSRSRSMPSPSTYRTSSAWASSTPTSSC